MNFSEIHKFASSQHVNNSEKNKIIIICLQMCQEYNKPNEQKIENNI